MPRRHFIPMAAPLLGDTELANVTAAVRSGWISGTGPFVDALEEGFARAMGVAHAVAVCNGTAALHLALAAAGIGEGDEVIVPALTHISTLNALTFQRAQPVVVDVEPDTWCVDPAAVERAVTPRTRAVVAVHLYGHPCDMAALGVLARRHDLLVIEDAAQAHGAKVGGRAAGSLGHIAAFSFYANKIMTTGEGGMVTTGDPHLAERARRLRDQAHGKVDRFVHDAVGFNYRMTNVAAAIGVAQLARLDELIAHRRGIAARYRAGLEGVPGLVPPVERPGTTNVHWMYATLVQPAFGYDRDTLAASLRERGIDTRPFFHPAHLQPAYARLVPPATCPVAEAAARQGLNLPSGNELSPEEVDAVIGAIRELSPNRGAP